MNLIICMGQNGEMLFNKRRVVQDSSVRENIIESISPHMLYMSAYSGTLFAMDFSGEYFSVEDIEKVGTDEWYYCEDPKELTSENIAKANRIMLYRWEREYPREECFDNEILNNFKLIETTPFKYDRINTSKIKITKCVYERK